MTRRTRAALASMMAVSGLLAGCSSDDLTDPEGGETALSLSVALGPDGIVGAVRSVFDVEQSDGTNVLVMSRVVIVLRDIELERQFDDCPEPGEEFDEDECEKFETGPILLELPLDGQVEQVVQVEVEADTYDELEFEVHKPDDDDPDDLAFIQTNPTFEDVSIRVEGTFNGETFIFEQDLNEEQEVELVPPLVVEPGAGSINLTMVLDVTTWFIRQDGSLVDPRTANKGQPNENLVRDNIRASIEGTDAFEDSDRDGKR